MRRSFPANFLLVFLVCAIAIAPTKANEAAQPTVDKLVLDDTIQPITSSVLDRAIAQAASDHAAALLVELDTPGGLLDSTRHMVGAILNSPVPIIVYISPAGARGGSAGFFLLESADIAAMAPGTNAGASHPVLSTGEPDSTMKEKIENDAAAFLRSYVTDRGRNAAVAETAVRSSKSFTADEALAQHLIDLIAPDEVTLIHNLDGRIIKRANGSVTLRLRDARIRTIEPSLREQILSRLANPNIALLLLVGGALLIYLEFNIPGTIVPGAIGTVMVLLSIFALDFLPIRHTALLFLIAAAALIVMELKFASHGILAAFGIVCLAFGTLTLIDAPIPELVIHPWVAISLCTAFGLITLFLTRLAMRARRNKALTGPAALVGAFGTAMEPICTDQVLPLGHILVEGEIWRATSEAPISEHDRVRVTGFHGDVLEVHPAATILIES